MAQLDRSVLRELRSRAGQGRYVEDEVLNAATTTALWDGLACLHETEFHDLERPQLAHKMRTLIDRRMATELQTYNTDSMKLAKQALRVAIVSLAVAIVSLAIAMLPLRH